jgi:hypothetical protein
MGAVLVMIWGAWGWLASRLCCREGTVPVKSAVGWEKPRESNGIRAIVYQNAGCPRAKGKVVSAQSDCFGPRSWVRFVL